MPVVGGMVAHGPRDGPATDVPGTRTTGRGSGRWTNPCHPCRDTSESVRFRWFCPQRSAPDVVGGYGRHEALPLGRRRSPGREVL